MDKAVTALAEYQVVLLAVAVAVALVVDPAMPLLQAMMAVQVDYLAAVRVAAIIHQTTL
jgi:hypothetical protein